MTPAAALHETAAKMRAPASKPVAASPEPRKAPVRYADAVRNVPQVAGSLAVAQDEWEEF